MRLNYAIFASTLILFTIESLLHYNVGKNDLTDFRLPSMGELIKIILILIIFSVLNVYLIDYIN